jgi:CRP/FNR family transcriptional regulator
MRSLAVNFVGTALPASVRPIAGRKSHCQTCATRELCLPVGLGDDELARFEGLIAHRTKMKKHDALYRTGEPFHALYAIQVGSLKSTMLAEDGSEQVTGFHIFGEIIGFDGIGNDHHRTEAIALEDTEVCVVPFVAIEGVARAMPALQHNLHRLLSEEIARSQGLMLLLGSMRAEERLAAFLLNLAGRYRRRGYSSTEFGLRLSRNEIGSYLGLTLETVSRLFSRFQADGLLQVEGRSVKLLDVVALKRMVGERG